MLPQPADRRLEFLQPLQRREGVDRRVLLRRCAGCRAPRGGSNPVARQGNRRTRRAARPPTAPGRAASPQPGTVRARRRRRWRCTSEVLAERQVRVAASRRRRRTRVPRRGGSPTRIGHRVARSAVARPGVGVVAAGHHVEDAVDVVDRAGHHADAVQRFARRHEADGADQPARRLEPDDAVECGGHAARAGGVGGHGERHLAERHRQRRTGTRAAGDHLAAVHTARDRCTACGCR